MRRILLVDDHPLIVEGYKMALSNHEAFATSFVFDKAGDCTEAKSKIDEAIANKAHYDLASSRLS